MYLKQPSHKPIRINVIFSCAFNIAGLNAQDFSALRENGRGETWSKDKVKSSRFLNHALISQMLGGWNSWGSESPMRKDFDGQEETTQAGFWWMATRLVNIHGPNPSPLSLLPQHQPNHVPPSSAPERLSHDNIAPDHENISNTSFPATQGKPIHLPTGDGKGA